MAKAPGRAPAARTLPVDPETAAAASADKRVFTAASNVLCDGAAVAPGEPVALTEVDHAALRAIGAIEAGWDEGEAATTEG